MDAKTLEKGIILNFPALVEYSDNGIISKRIIDKPAGNITLFSFDEGQKLSEHTAPFDALAQVIEGNAEILIDQKSYFLKTDESIIMPANIPHAVKAPEMLRQRGASHAGVKIFDKIFAIVSFDFLFCFSNVHLMKSFPIASVFNFLRRAK